MLYTQECSRTWDGTYSQICSKDHIYINTTYVCKDNILQFTKATLANVAVIGRYNNMATRHVIYLPIKATCV